MAAELDLVIEKGETFYQVFRWETEPFLFAEIAAISNGAPVVVTMMEPHGLTDGWRAAVVGAVGLTDFNAKHNPPQKSDFYRCSVVSETEVAFNPYNSLLMKPWRSGGYLQWYTPQDLTGFTADLVIRPSVSSETVLVELSVGAGVTLDAAANTITVSLTADATRDFDFKTGVYDLVLTSPTGVATVLVGGAVTVEPKPTAP